MKISHLLIAGSLALGAMSANAQGYVSIGGPGFSLSLSDGGRYYGYNGYPVYSAPAYVYTPPVYYNPPPVYYTPPVTYYNPGYRFRHDRGQRWDRPAHHHRHDRPRYYYNR